MDIVQLYRDNLDVIKSHLEEVAENSIKVNGKRIIDLVRYGQLRMGVDSFGKDLIHPSKRQNTSRVPLYEPATELYWAKRSPMPRNPKITNRRYNFEWTGQLFDSLDINFNEKESFTIFSTTGKKNFLEDIYQTKLTKLNDEHNQIINEEVIKPAMIEYILENFYKI